MAIYRLNKSNIEKLEETTFSQEGVRERQDLQQILKDSIDVIAPNTLVIAEEFGEWNEGSRRIDLLAIDKDANLVVIELKRTQDGGHMELQSIRYAAMISMMTFQRAVEVYADFSDISSLVEAETEILNFLDWDTPSEEDFANDVRIILASGEFSRELTTSVLWLNERGLDIKCIRMKPYRTNEGLLINIEQVIPLPEAEEFQISVREKREKQRKERATNRDTLPRDIKINGTIFNTLPKRRIIFEVVKAAVENGATIEEIRTLMPKPKWICVEGELNQVDFLTAATELRAKEGRTFQPGRFFTDESQLFQQDGKTYALSNQWGKVTQGSVSKIRDHFCLNIEIDW